jgi:bifunctional oligoribonuclease and PAP phosphatase NrnA
MPFPHHLKLQSKKAWELLNSSQNILLTTHENTDGDDLGSLLAILKVLRKEKKRVTAMVTGGIPKNLTFLPDHQLVTEARTAKSEELSEFDLLVTFGCGRLERTGLKWFYGKKIPIINFDHHPDNTKFGVVNIVDDSASSVAEITYHFLKTLDFTIEKDMATCLLTGIFTDTGGFKHANTSADALEAAADLLKKGARIDRIAQQTTGRKQPATIKAWAKGLENTRLDLEKRMVFSILTEEDLKDIGATDEDLEGFVELLNNIPQARFALLLRQDGEVVKGSLRSEPHKQVDVSRIAKSFGGGGHKLASGFKIKGKLVKENGAWKII